ncbi:MAG: acetate--CoA ligase family protein [Burkholderiaceae bacterium]
MTRAPARDLSPLLDPRSVVVIGASDEVTRIGGRPIQLAREYGYAGQMVAVNPKYGTVQGLPCYPDIDSVPTAPELAILAVGSKDVLPQLEACARKGVRAAVIFAGGFAETATEAGRELQTRLTELARRSSMLIAGPNTIGLVNVAGEVYATFMTAMLENRPRLGEVALVAQSGGACIAVYNALVRRGVGFDYILSSGNEADVDFNDFLTHVSADPRTRVVAGYVEGLSDGARFIELLDELGARRLPVAIYKVGETQAGADAAASHTARMAGSHRVFHAALHQLGAMAADDMEQLAELAYLARFSARSAGLRMGILTTSGAYAAILTDKFIGRGLQVPALSAALQQRLRPQVPAFATVANPVDITANIVNSLDGFEATLATLLATDELDAVVLFSTSNLIDRLAPAICRAASASQRLLVVLVTGDIGSESSLVASGVPVFHDTGRGAQALATLAHWHAHHARGRRWQDRGRRAGATTTAGAATAAGKISTISTTSTTATPGTTATADAYLAAAARPVIRAAASAGRTRLSEHEGKQLLAAAGIAVNAGRVATSADEAALAARTLGWPVVMKVSSADIVHKSEAGGVRLGIADADQARLCYREILAAASAAHPAARIDGVLVEPQQAPGIELLLSSRHDPLFGPVISVGLGGTTAELFADVSVRLLPIDETDAREMLHELRMHPLLAGYRGAPPADEDAIVAAMTRLSALTIACSDSIAEIEINPLIAQPRGGGAAAVDCVVLLHESPAAQTTGQP